MGSGCSTQANEAVLVDSSLTHHHRRRSNISSNPTTTNNNNNYPREGGASVPETYHTPSPRLLQYLASNNVGVNDDDDEDDEDDLSADDVAYHGGAPGVIGASRRRDGRDRHRRRRSSTTRPASPPPPRGMAGWGHRRRQRRRRHEEDVRFAEVLALQQSLAAMEDFFQSLLSHSHLLLEVMDPAADGGTSATMGGPPPASQAVLRNLPRRRWGDVVQQQQQQQQTIAAAAVQKVSCCSGETHHQQAPTLSTSPAEKTVLEEDTECGVCFESHQEEDLVIELPCGHVYHVDCVEDWLQRHCTCPTCRYELPTDDLMFERGRKERMKGRSTTSTAMNTTTMNTTRTSQGMDDELRRMRPTYESPSASSFPFTDYSPPSLSRNRMRNVMNESPSSWFIDHLQSRVEEDPVEDQYYGRYDYRTYQIRSTPSSTITTTTPTIPPRTTLRFSSPSTRSTTPSSIIDADIVVEPQATVVTAAEVESNVASSAAASSAAAAAAAVAFIPTNDEPVEAVAALDNSDERPGDIADIMVQPPPEAKRPAITHFPQQDTCAGMDGLDSLSSYAEYGRAGATTGEFSCDSENDMEEKEEATAVAVGAKTD